MKYFHCYGPMSLAPQSSPVRGRSSPASTPRPPIWPPACARVTLIAKQIVSFQNSPFIFIFLFPFLLFQFSSHTLQHVPVVWFSLSWPDRRVPEPKIRAPFWTHRPFNTHPKRCGSRRLQVMPVYPRCFITRAIFETSNYPRSRFSAISRFLFVCPSWLFFTGRVCNKTLLCKPSPRLHNWRWIVGVDLDAQTDKAIFFDVFLIDGQR